MATKKATDEKDKSTNDKLKATTTDKVGNQKDENKTDAPKDNVKLNEYTSQKNDARTEPKIFKGSDLIRCRSVRQGTLLLPGKKSDNLYRWMAYGDETEVEYQDLLALKASRSRYLTEPFLIVEDEELLSDPRWKDVKAVYDSMCKMDDIDSLLNLDNHQFERLLPTLPNGLKSALATEVATRIESGTFDSIKKVKTIDRICGTDLSFMLQD